MQPATIGRAAMRDGNETNSWLKESLENAALILSSRPIELRGPFSLRGNDITSSEDDPLIESHSTVLRTA